MPQSVSSIHLDSLSVDPTSPVEGQLWYNSTDKKLRKVINGLTEEVQLVSSAHKTSVRITTTSSIANLSNTTVTISGVTCVAGDRVLVQNNASRDGIEAVAASHNGVYTVGTVTAGMAAFTRSSDANTAAKLAGMTVLCQSCGTYHALALAASAITLETTALNFVSVASKAHSNGTVTIDSNGISVGSITDAQVATANKDGTAGTVSLRTLGTGAAQACAGNDARLTDDRTGAGLRSATTVVSVSSATAPTSGQVLTATSGTAATWQTSGGTAYPRYSFGAPDFDTPNSSDWTINAAGALAQDSVNSGLSVIRFDDTTEEGVGFTIYVPSGVTNLTFRFVSRAQTAPGGAVTVRPVIYVRESVDNSTVEAWSSATLMTAVDIPTNANYQYDSQTIALSTLSMVAGRVAQLELTRRGTDASDTLTGDWNLLQLVVELT